MTSEKIVDEGAVGDRYDFIKSSYLQHREYVIHDGNLPEENELLPEDDEPL
jgi:phospholipid-binding lipoprotein MlaA